MSLQPRLWRVEFSLGYGFPEPYKREMTQRTYGTAGDAGRMVRTIRAHPSHHDLIGVWTTRTAWRPVDPDTLPVPESTVTELEEIDQ